MCGILGVIRKGDSFLDTIEDFFRQGLLVNQLRGEHATGMALINNNNINIIKKNCAGADFVQLSPFNEVKRELSSSALVLAHNRKATVGTNTINNAHPFSIGNITLVHNGHILNHGKLSDKEHIFQVDSEAICYSVNKIGVEETINKFYPNDAFALAFHDKQTNTLNLIRNEKRDLYLAICEDIKTIFFGSEKGMLEFLLARVKIKATSIVEVSPNRLLSFKSEDVLNWSHKDIKRIFPKTIDKQHPYFWEGNEEHTFFPSKNYPTTTGDKSYINSLKVGERIIMEIKNVSAYKKSTAGTVIGVLRNNEHIEVVSYHVDLSLLQGYKSVAGNITCIIANTQRNLKDRIVISNVKPVQKIRGVSREHTPAKEDDLRVVKGPNKNEFITEKAFTALTCSGCAMCGNSIFLEDHEDILWIDNKNPACKKCSNPKSATLQ